MNALFTYKETYENGRHFEAALTLQQLYKKVINSLRTTSRNATLQILDFGSGRYGIGRALLQTEIQNTDTLSLYDPCTTIERVNGNSMQNVRIIQENEILGERRIPFDIVNISYVLCLIETQEAKELLANLVKHHPQANFVICDYILHNRSNSEVLNLLSSHEEIKWQQRLGAAEFCRTHKRFSEEGFLDLLEQSGLKITNLQPLDDSNFRMGAVTHGNTGSVNHDLMELRDNTAI